MSRIGNPLDWESFGGRGEDHALPNAIRRYGRLTICATGDRLFTFTRGDWIGALALFRSLGAGSKSLEASPRFQVASACLRAWLGVPALIVRSQILAGLFSEVP